MICNSEVRRLLTVLVPTVRPQMNSELDSWWLALEAIRHRHMTNSTMDFSRTHWFAQKVPICSQRFEQDCQMYSKN